MIFDPAELVPAAVLPSWTDDDIELVARAMRSATRGALLESDIAVLTERVVAALAEAGRLGRDKHWSVQRRGEAMNSHEVMKDLAAHARALGWQIVEWDWNDESDGDEEYTVWLREIQPVNTPKEGPCTPTR